MDPRLLKSIACPRCHGRLQIGSAEAFLICPVDRLRFPIESGIPVLLLARARSDTTLTPQ